MNKLKTLTIVLLILLTVFCSGCQKKEPAGDLVPAEPDTAIPSVQAVGESTSSAVDTTAAGVNENKDTSESISVVSKSDSTIAQAEKKKVLDDISNEIDGLIDEVNKDSSSSDQLE